MRREYSMITAVFSVALGMLKWTLVNKKIWILHNVIDFVVFREILVVYGVRIGSKCCYSQDSIFQRKS